MKAASVPLNGIEMYYETEGAGGPLLLLHGGAGCQENWSHAGRDRFAREYTLILPDVRGHGRTTNPQKTITHRHVRWIPSHCWIILALASAGRLDLAWAGTFFSTWRPCNRSGLKPWFS
jgi:pimeloyl-ACP methyl ester carboxylesterase